jgi:arginyl-tRNA synthetase
MNIFKEYQDIVAAEIAALVAEGALPAAAAGVTVTVEPPRDAAHGDLSTNAALVLARPAGRPPREIARALAERLARRPMVEAAEIAGPGFVNLRLDAAAWQRCVAAILTEGAQYGASRSGAGRRINVEYVSANPTGPMHVGHARGAVLGDALAALLATAGHEVTREFYINDAGAQVDALARSVHLRYREALGETIGAIPDGLYPGDYLQPVGRDLAARDGDQWLHVAEAEWLPVLRDFAVAAMMALIAADLAALGVRHDVFRAESELAASGAIDQVVAALAARDLVYTGVLAPPKGKRADDWEPRPQMLFRSTEFGDDVDRPLRKSDGSWTYFAADIAYHLDKFRRGFTTMIDVWGADHKGYVKRMQAAVEAVTGGAAVLDVRICNLVHLFEAGVPVKMSKRAGSFVTLREVVERVGRDVVRFIMLTRSSEAALDFDFARVVEQSKDNPVFYVQYAHARSCSVLRNAHEALAETALDDSSLAKADLSRLNDASELALIRLLAGWPRLVESAADAHEPHRIAYYLSEVAAGFHGLWTKGNEDPDLRFIMADDRELSCARLALVRAVAVVIAAGLTIMGVQPVQEMR